VGREVTTGGITTGAEAPPFKANTADPSAGFESGGTDTVDTVHTSAPDEITVTFRITCWVNPAGKKSSGHVTVCPAAVQPDPRSTIDETRLTPVGKFTVNVVLLEPWMPSLTSVTTYEKAEPTPEADPDVPNDT
jgi:hypothetical protein